MHSVCHVTCTQHIASHLHRVARLRGDEGGREGRKDRSGAVRGAVVGDSDHTHCPVMNNDGGLSWAVRRKGNITWPPYTTHEPVRPHTPPPIRHPIRPRATLTMINPVNDDRRPLIRPPRVPSTPFVGQLALLPTEDILRPKFMILAAFTTAVAESSSMPGRKEEYTSRSSSLMLSSASSLISRSAVTTDLRAVIIDVFRRPLHFATSWCWGSDREREKGDKAGESALCATCLTTKTPSSSRASEPPHADKALPIPVFRTQCDTHKDKLRRSAPVVRGTRLSTKHGYAETLKRPLSG